VAAYLVEAGIILIVGPWSTPWDRNYFAFYVPSLGDLMSNEYVRGAVTGIGVVTIISGLRELTGAFLGRGTPDDVDPGANQPGRP
jgi:hypothetical protein